MGQQPETEEGKHRFREKVTEDIRTKFERFRRWAKENLGAQAAIVSYADLLNGFGPATYGLLTLASNSPSRCMPLANSIQIH